MKRIRLLLVLSLTGCAAIPGFAPRAGLTLALPDQAARVARETFVRHGFPVRASSARNFVRTDVFIATNVWSPTELNANVECTDPKQDARPESAITIQIRADIQSYAGSSDGASPNERSNRPNSLVSVRSTGNREDGGKCKLTESYAAALLEEIVMVGGKPMGRTTGAGF